MQSKATASCNASGAAASGLRYARGAGGYLNQEREMKIELSNKEVEAIIRNHIQSAVVGFCGYHVIEVSAQSYSGLAANVFLNTDVPTDTETKEA